MKKLAFVGAGSHSDAIQPFIDTDLYELVGYFDDKDVSEHNGLPILGSPNEVVDFIDNGQIDAVFVTVGDNVKRAEWFESIRVDHYDALINIIAPTAIIIDNNSLKGRGIFIGSGAFVGAKAEVYDDVIVNTYAVAEHHSILNNHVNLTPRAVLAGFVNVHEGAYLGLNSSIIQLLEIAPWTTIGAGTVVIHDITETGTYVGSPAKKVR